MKTKFALLALALLAGPIFNAAESTACAQGTAFTYQGRLSDGANAANGAYDLRFAIYDSTNLPGTMVSGLVTNSATGVSNGLFLATLDFGTNVFGGADCWLEIAVRTNGTVAFTTVNPRQKITPTPYAMTAGSLADVVANNTVGSGLYDTVSGGSANTATGNFYATVGGGVGNFSFGYSSTIGGGYYNTNTGGFATVAGGAGNVASGAGAFVGGGGSAGNGLFGNKASGVGSVVVGGFTNIVGSFASSIVGGSNNTIQVNADGAFIGGGVGNLIQSGPYGVTIGGGVINTAGGNYYSTIAGGVGNYNFGYAAVIAGGIRNTNIGNYAVIGGGAGNNASGSGSFVGGGGSVGAGVFANTASGPVSVVVGGLANTVGAFAASVMGGSNNVIQTGGDNGFIGGGFNNGIQTGAISAAISGGFGNHIQADSQAATISGGSINTIQTNGIDSVIAGGSQNSIGRFSWYSVIGGGAFNQVSNLYATVPGGEFNVAAGMFSFAAGKQAQALHNGSFVWADSQSGAFASTGNDQFLVRAQGGVGINKNNPASTLDVNGTERVQGGNNWNVTGSEGDFRVGNDAYRFKIGVANDGSGSGDVWMRAHGGTGRVFLQTPGGTTIFSNEAQTSGVSLAAGGGAWSNLSDRNAKENFVPVDAQGVLNRVASLPLSSWNYKSQEQTIRHLGPMAQDFAAAFQVGEDERHITTIDSEGVALAAIQGLNQKVEGRMQNEEGKIQQLQAENAELKERNDSLEKRLSALEAKLR